MTGTHERPLSNEWSDLRAVGGVPGEGKGTTAERAARDAARKRKRMPAEDRRSGRKISPTLSLALVQRLKAICQEQGYVTSDGDGLIASLIIEDLLWYAVDAYDRGELVVSEIPITDVQRRLRAKRQKSA